jgi:hypothetical protein
MVPGLSMSRFRDESLEIPFFFKGPSDFHPQLGARQAADFNPKSSHSLVQSMNLLAYLP